MLVHKRHIVNRMVIIMHIHEVILAMGIMLLLAKLGEEIFRRKGIPGFIAPILVGLVMGPLGLKLITHKDLPLITIFTVLGIDFLLFISGVEELAEISLASKRIKQLIFSSIIMFVSSLIILLSILILALNIDVGEAILVAIIMSTISLGPLVRALIEGGLLSSNEGKCLVVIAALSEVISIMLFNAIIKGGSITIFVVTILAMFGFYVFGKYFFVPIVRLIENYISAREAPFAVIVALILLTGRIAELVGFNSAIVALGLGIFSSPYLISRPDILNRLKAFTYGFFEPLFFIGLGLYVSHLSYEGIGLGFLMALITSLVRVILLKEFAQINRLDMLSLSLAKGGVDAALLLIAYDNGLISSQVYTITLVSIITMAFIFSIPIRRHILVNLKQDLEKKRVAYLIREKIYAFPDTPILDIINLLKEKTGIVVVDKNMRPIGHVSSAELLYVEPSRIGKAKVYEIMNFSVPILYEDEHIDDDVIDLICNSHVVAVVDKDGKLVGTLYPKDIIEWLSGKKKRERTIRQA